MNRGIIRQATVADIPRLIDLLYQVNMVHHRLRPELFKPDTTKYSEQELETLVGDVNFELLDYLSKHELVVRLPKLKFTKDKTCDAC